MIARKAAVMIGTSINNISILCRKGIRKRTPGPYLRAKKIPLKKGDMGFGRHQFRWEIPNAEVRRFMKLEISGQGSRGKKRKSR